MAHSKQEYKFNTEAEAVAFIERMKANKSPAEDQYIRGPFFMDMAEVLKGMNWSNNTEKYWAVDVESFY